MAQSKTILHADDVQRWRDLVADSLSDDYRIVSVEDCDGVLPRLRQGGIDLVVLDHLMPSEDADGTGFEVCQQIRKQYPQLPIVVFSGAWDDMKIDPRELEAKWGARFLHKSSGGESLRRVVGELLAS